MALNKEQLKQGIIALQQDMQRKTDASMEEYAERLASLIEAFVKSGEVTVQSGISVARQVQPPPKWVLLQVLERVQ